MRLKLTETEKRLMDYFKNEEGLQAQVDMTMEEVGELLTAINHHKRGRVSSLKVAEEIADVQIMLAVLSKFYGEVNVDDMLDSKVGRVIERLGDKFKPYG